MPQHGRHAALRTPSRRRALLLPTVLLAAGGTAFAGMAVVPAAADSVPPAAPPVRVQAVAAPAAQSEVELLRSLRAAAAQARPPRAEQARPPARASRDRTRPTAAGAASAAESTRKPATKPVARPARKPVAKPKPKPAPPAFVRPGTGRVTSSFGPRWGRLHAGLDLAAGTGAPILAAARGTVLSAGSEGGYGNVVRLQHAEGTVTVYAHLSQVLVAARQPVVPGQVIGREGSTGHSTGPHLHFEVRVGGVPVDPAPWLRARGVDPAAQ